jgi:hypothetical protein
VDYREKKSLMILFSTIQWILDSYFPHHIPYWLFSLWHPRSQQISTIKKTLKRKLQNREHLEEESFIKKVDDFILILDAHRYYLSVHTQSKLLREKVQEAMIVCLSFSERERKLYHDMVEKKGDISLYLKSLIQSAEIVRYRDYYRTQHSIYGRNINRFTDEEILLAARGGLINGKLLDRFGMCWVIRHNLFYIRKELESILKRKNKKGFLTEAVMEGYFIKMDGLIDSCNRGTMDLMATLQNTRYLLEAIVNGAGTLPGGEAQISQYQGLIDACYWVDECLVEAKGALEVI